MPKLTPISVANAKANGSRREIPDAGCSGLYLIVQPSGAKSWALRFRYHGQPRKLTLGPVLQADDELKNVAIGMPLTLKGARRLATAELHKLSQGVDPNAAKNSDRAALLDRATQKQRDSVDAVARQFLDLYAKKKTKSWRQTARILGLKPDDGTPGKWVKTGSGILEKWSGRSIHDITKRNVIALLDEMVQRDAPIGANRTLAAIRKMFNWSVGRDMIDISPCAGIEPPGEERSRDRILSDDEIVTLWRVCGEIGEPYGSFVRLLLLCGQRLQEVSGMRRSEIDGDGNWSIPGTRTKNKKAHLVPLSRQALAIVMAAPRVGDSDLVWTTTGAGPINGFSKFKARLDESLKFAEPWVFHDLRRSCASGMQGLGCPVGVIERALNHVSGSFKGIAGVYQRNPLTDETRAALQAWADHVDRLISGKTAKVVPLRKRAVK
jgi:integrase